MVYHPSYEEPGFVNILFVVGSIQYHSVGVNIIFFIPLEPDDCSIRSQFVDFTSNVRRICYMTTSPIDRCNCPHAVNISCTTGIKDINRITMGFNRFVSHLPCRSDILCRTYYFTKIFTSIYKKKVFCHDIHLSPTI